MSKQRLSGIGEKSGSSIHSRMNASKELIEAKNKMWTEMIQRKEEAKKAEEKPKPGRPKLQTGLLDKYFERTSAQRAQGLACYVIASRLAKSDDISKVADRYGVSNTTLYNYVKSKHGLYRLPKHIIKIKKNLDEDLAKSSVTVQEVKRLLGLSFVSLKEIGYTNHITRKPNDDLYDSIEHIEDDAFLEDYDHMLNDEQKVELMDLANLELSEIKPVTKSDLVVGVITGALVGGAMVAYAFLTNGAI